MLEYTLCLLSQEYKLDKFNVSSEVSSNYRVYKKSLLLENDFA